MFRLQAGQEVMTGLKGNVTHLSTVIAGHHPYLTALGIAAVLNGEGLMRPDPDREPPADPSQKSAHYVLTRRGAELLAQDGHPYNTSPEVLADYGPVQLVRGRTGVTSLPAPKVLLHLGEQSVTIKTNRPDQVLPRITQAIHLAQLEGQISKDEAAELKRRALELAEAQGYPV